MNVKNTPMRVSTRLAIGFGTIVTVSIGMAFYSAAVMMQLSKGVDDIANKMMVRVGQLTLMQNNLNGLARNLRNAIITDDDAFRLTQKNQYEEKLAAYHKTLAELDQTAESANEAELLKVVREKTAPFFSAMEPIMDEAMNRNKAAAGAMLFGENLKLQNPLFNSMDAARNLQVDKAISFARETQHVAARGLLVMATLGAFMALVGFVVGWLTARAIRRELGAEPRELSAMVDRVADGDLSLALQVPAGDSTSVLATLARMQGSLHDVVHAVRGGADGVATASAQISQGTLDLSHRTERQASSLEETAAAMEQLSSTVRQTAEHALEANRLSRDASNIARKGGEVVQQVVDTMNGINSSSRRVENIIGVIDSIAFQTNILALNAAVEAARAGAQGRGFAVVATEVRNLAHRSAEAAKEIKALISASVERVAEGSQLVESAGATMLELVSSVQSVSDIMGEISSASTEQSAGVSQVGKAVADMDRTTQQNAALVEESAAAAESLKSQAENLVKAVSLFTLAENLPPVMKRLERPRSQPSLVGAF